MDQLTINAASGLRARLEAIEMLANNLANVSAAGYKVDRESYSLYAAPEADGVISQLPVVETQWTDFAQGTLTPTGNWSDLALSGGGFFVVQAPGGALYTRNGAFRLSGDGRLETLQGYAVRGVGGAPITVDPAYPVEVTLEGAVLQQGREVGRLELAEISPPRALIKQDGLYFRLNRPDGAVVRPAAAQVHQGVLESSNVVAPESAVRMISLMRQFEMLQRAIALGAEMNRRGVEEVARVNS